MKPTLLERQALEIFLHVSARHGCHRQSRSLLHIYNLTRSQPTLGPRGSCWM